MSFWALLQDDLRMRVGRQGRGMSEKVKKPQLNNQGNSGGNVSVYYVIPSTVVSV